MRLVLASSNPGKLRELTQLLRPLGHTLTSQGELGIEPAEETGSTFLENALLKARHTARLAQSAALADDSGIEVDALGGQPGVYSARYAGPNASDEENLHKLLAELHDVPAGRRQARYHCVIVLLRQPEDPDPLIAQGSWEGEIATAPRGSGGFGYDPAFIPAGSHITAAEMPAAQKNAVSHRGQALAALVAALEADGLG
jgi:XTP/dITP diphosphohydrolase